MGERLDAMRMKLFPRQRPVRNATVLIISCTIGILIGSVSNPLGIRTFPNETVHVTGIGGVFFKAKDPAKLREWYRTHLGIDAEEMGVNFFWRDINEQKYGRTVWSLFPQRTTYFGESTQAFMINYRIRNLDTLLNELRNKGVHQVGAVEEYWYGRFAWVVDGEGNRVELWEPDGFTPEELLKRMEMESRKQ